MTKPQDPAPQQSPPREELLEQELARERKARKQAEGLLEKKSLELYQRNQDLQREVNERLRAEDLLRAHADALARSNQELEQFAYVASHDLQAPLRSITGFSRLLLKHAEDQLGDKGIEYLNFIESSAKHLHRLINDLLEYSRVGRAEHRPVWVDANVVVQQACRQLEGAIADRDAKVRYEGLPRIYADATLLVQLFQNLIGNGIKYSRPDASPEIRISASEQDGWWRFAVADNGIGMAKEDRERIFTIFQRLHSAEQYEGTGIGLSICKKIVERHGGRIWVDSAPGKGSTFFFMLTAPDRAVPGTAA